MSIEKGWVHRDGQTYTCPQGASRAMGRKERRAQETSHYFCGQPMWLIHGHLKLSKSKTELILLFLFYSPFEAEIYPFPKPGLQCHVTFESLCPQASQGIFCFSLSHSLVSNPQSLPQFKPCHLWPGFWQQFQGSRLSSCSHSQIFPHPFHAKNHTMAFHFLPD